jgi:tetratricopeptide (TPR) repeat protein
VPSKPDQAANRARNCHLAAPPLTQAEGQAEGAAILTELERDTAAVLAGTVRDLMLWLDHQPAERCLLFSPGAKQRREAILQASQLEESLRPLVRTIQSAVDPAANPDPARLQSACTEIAAWAEEFGAPATRLAFLQVAAVISGRDSQLALEVGRSARDLGDHARGESWFRHAVRLGRNRDWNAYVWAYVGLGVLYIRCGNFPAANAVMMRALRTAERHRFRELAGVAHHHLFHLTTEAGRLNEAYEHARRALSAYGRESPKLPGLASDVGRFWLHMGQSARALPLFEAAVPAINDPNVRAMVAANVVRAAAGVGDRERYERARETALTLIAAAVGRVRLEDAYEALAHADLTMAPDRARVTAAEALRIATATGNAEVRLNAETLLERACGRVVAKSEAPAVEAPTVARLGERLAGDLVGALVAAR